jgi:hypothetical protein
MAIDVSQVMMYMTHTSKVVATAMPCRSASRRKAARRLVVFVCGMFAPLVSGRLHAEAPAVVRLRAKCRQANPAG